MILLALGAAFGAGLTYLFKEDETKQLRKAALDLEDSHAKLERELRAAATREAKQRIENVRLVIAWCTARLQKLEAANEAPLVQLQRSWAAAKALQQIAERLLAKQELGANDQRFVDLMVLVSGAAGKRVSADDVEWMDAYMGQAVPETKVFVEQKFTDLLRDKQQKLLNLRNELSAVEREIVATQLRQHISGDLPALRETLAHAEKTRAQLPAQIERVVHEVDQLKRNVVIIVRVNDPDANDPADHRARALVELIVRKRDLDDADWAFLETYRDAYFAAASDQLARRGIDLMSVAEAA